MPADQKRGIWSRRLGFILATAGSAVGLGNIWRFPTIVGESGGAAFVALYLTFVLLLGLPIMLATLAIGRTTQCNPVGALRRLAPGSSWPIVGSFCVLTSLAILSYYSVIASWSLAYVTPTLTGKLAELPDPAAVAEAFDNMHQNRWAALGYLAVFLGLTMAAVAGGIRSGIERWCNLLMPTLLAILLLLVLRSVTLSGAREGLSFYLAPDFSRVTPDTVLNALSQAFFSLSLGMGIMITYGSYLSQEHDLITSSFWIVGADTLIAFLAGFAIFPALFTVKGLAPDAGPELVFLVLPNVFNQIPGGVFFGAGFFVLLTVAALTSTISLTEVVVACVIDEWHWPRGRAVVLVGLVTFAVAIPSALSAGGTPVLSELPLVGISFLELMDAFFGKIALAVSSLLLCWFVGWRWGADQALAEIQRGSSIHWMRRPWRILIRYVCPIIILVVLVTQIVQQFQAD